MGTTGDDAGSPPVWYFDLISPFAYLALPAIEALSARRQVVFRPIVFGAVLSHWGHLGPAEIAPKRLHTYRLVQFMAEQAGLRFRFPPQHPFRSLDALRLLAGLDGAPGAVRAAFDFVWAEGRDPGDPAECAALCDQLGVDDFDAFIAAHDAKGRLRRWTDEAIGAGLFGVPTLKVGTDLFWGVDAMPLAEACLADPAMLRHGEMARLETLPVGVGRKV